MDEGSGMDHFQSTGSGHGEVLGATDEFTGAETEEGANTTGIREDGVAHAFKDGSRASDRKSMVEGEGYGMRFGMQKSREVELLGRKRHRHSHADRGWTKTYTGRRSGNKRPSEEDGLQSAFTNPH